MMKKMNNKSRFWRIYAIVFGTALALSVAFFVVFFDIMKNYEHSQPASGIETFLISLTAEDIENVISDAVSNAEPFYDDREAVLASLRQKIKPDALEYRKDYTSYTWENPVYKVSCGDMDIYRVTLAAGEALRYGFSSWVVEKQESLLSVHDLPKHTSHVYVPRGATLSVNGIEVEGDPVGTSTYLYGSKWEPDGILKTDYYRIEHFSDAEFSCILDGFECESRTEEDGIRFLYPTEALVTCTIEAPSSANVTVNGVLLEESEIVEAGIPYEASPFEAMLDDLPTAVVYKVEGLSVLPKVKAELNGQALTFDCEDNTFRGAYPDEMRYSCTIRVPEGSTVTLRGVPCTPIGEPEAEIHHGELFSYSGKVPTYDLYTINRLFLKPDGVEILYNGISLPYTVTEEGNLCAIDAAYPRIDAPETVELALTFVKTYFFYTSNGSNNTNQNMMNVLGYIPYGCPLYWKIVQTENGFSWTSPVVSMTYNTLAVTDVVSYPGDLRLCHVDFDVSQTFYGGVHREYSGEMLVLVTADGQVVGLEINA